MRVLSYYKGKLGLSMDLCIGKQLGAPRDRHTWILSTHICVMALTLVGVTPGGFNVDRDCNCVVNSSKAAMIRARVPVRLDEEIKRDPWSFCTETRYVW
jgi:hypothetical protein